MLTAMQIAEIRRTWALVEPIADEAAALFYRVLLEDNPGLRPLFTHTDMASQRKKLMAALGLVVKSLDRLEAITPALEGLGRGHVQYGVQESHYGLVGRALLRTLHDGVGEAFTPDAREAWATAYGVVASVMIRAAEQRDVA